MVIKQILHYNGDSGGGARNETKKWSVVEKGLNSEIVVIPLKRRKEKRRSLRLESDT